MPQKRLTIPTFESERAEAAWWEKHRATVESDLRTAIREGKTTSLTNRDLDIARQLADNKGIGYQTFIKLLLHEELQRASGRPRK